MSQYSINIVILFSPAGVNVSNHPAVWAGHVTSPNTLFAARTWLKDADSSEHEALELKITNDLTSGWLFLERGGAEGHTSPSPSSSTTSVATSADISGQVSSELPAKDIVAYDVVNYNCYWFVAIIVGAIERVHHASVTPVGTGTIRGHLRMFQIVNREDIQKQLLAVTEREVEAEVERVRGDAQAEVERVRGEAQARVEQVEAERKQSSEAKNAIIQTLQAKLATRSTASNARRSDARSVQHFSAGRLRLARTPPTTTLSPTDRRAMQGKDDEETGE
ncbi:hypothetical protein FIBSPDRAFT_936074 [Athelia psychrophila]|uniref:Uncharacterized protein n=1 Tax=Athelia psychrophila TaxID=1759441 RepID=A0A166CNL8_9AGAM|nr:hypothetical protein FIBSPDRAFT_936074 [Fibularhizoctonia sp. CBS 109695]